jgi:UMF1 family MFS transporter
MLEPFRRPVWRAWMMYDWANSAFATTIMAALLPLYYSSVAAATLPPNIATAYWGYTNSAALLVSAILAPLLGAVADFRGSKKGMLMFFMGMGALATAFLYSVSKGDWLLASCLYVVANVGFTSSLVFYDSLLPHIAQPDEVDRVSTAGYATGYLGGGILLAINAAMLMLAPAALMAQMMRLSFVSVAIWWVVFSLPLWRVVPEPPARVQAGEEGRGALAVSFTRLGHTFRDIRQYKELFLFLVAFWFYSNGIGTIITMSVAYGAEIGIGQTDLIGTLLMVQFLGIPFSLLFGRLAGRIGAKNGVFLALVVYALICIGGFFMNAGWQFWVLGVGVAMVQGGSQALSRSLMARMVPKSKSGEFFGFFSISDKFASIAGPFLFGLVSQLVGHSRLSILSLIFFFIVGGFLLSRVNVDEGIRVAEGEEAGLQGGLAAEPELG